MDRLALNDCAIALEEINQHWDEGIHAGFPYICSMGLGCVPLPGVCAPIMPKVGDRHH